MNPNNGEFTMETLLVIIGCLLIANLFLLYFNWKTKKFGEVEIKLNDAYIFEYFIKHCEATRRNRDTVASRIDRETASVLYKSNDMYRQQIDRLAKLYDERFHKR